MWFSSSDMASGCCPYPCCRQLLVSQSSSMGREVRATQQQLDSLEGAVSTTGKELSHLAETMGGCLTAVHQEVASSSGSSYLSALLAPVTPNSGAAAAAAGGAFGPGRPQAAQWVGQATGSLHFAADE
jgi:hypothetical protein